MGKVREEKVKEPIFKAVAMPPRLFWAPMAPAGANIGVQLPMIFILQTFDSFNPLWIVATLVLVHIGIVIAGVKEPHLSQMMKSQGPFIHAYYSVYPEHGKKLSS